MLIVHEDQTEMSQSHPFVIPVPPDRFRNLEEFLTWIPPPPPRPLLVEFNRPFLIILIDSSTGIILLMGKVVNPTKE